MGIRFLCTACQNRLNVKSFLAGKRGVCPHCEASIRIPLESQILSRKEERAQAGGGDASSVKTVGEVAVQDPPASTNGAAGRPTSSEGVSPERSGNGRPHPDGDKAAEDKASPVAKSASEATRGARSDVAAEKSPAKAPVERPPAESPAAPTAESESPAAKTEEHQGDKLDEAAGHDIPVGEPANLPTGAPVASASPPPLPTEDPLEESPSLVWYVRPPSGGQYGPARGEIMKKWVAEGRVSADSLVWREGWPEWQTAGEILPTLREESAASSAGTPSIDTKPETARTATTAAPIRRRKKSNQLALVSVVLLVLVSIGLMATLVVKLTGGF